MTCTYPPELLSKILEAIFPDKLPTLAEYEQRFPPRKLREGAIVTRVGPSPTGFMHIGTVYVGLLSERFAHQTGGVCFIRIEDTDKKREVAGATTFICEAFDYFEIAFDEGRVRPDAERGQYGPYVQSARAAIYQSHVKWLLENGLAYPCFCTAEELDEIRQRQQAGRLRPGYYGDWALWRNKPAEEVLAALSVGKPYVIRFKSPGDASRKITFEDLIYGARTVPENDQDIVILKSDRLPTYHLAHAVDDHLMRTTHVIRGDEWLPSLPVHLQLFQALGWQPPTYAHIAPINKLDGSSKRKLSKRKDPEASVEYFINRGYPREAVLEYLLNIANSNFEDWRRDCPTSDYREFPLSFERLRNSSGPLFDFIKLENIARDVVARLSTPELQERLVAWARTHDPAFAAVLENDADYALRILSIERDGPKVRKDIGRWCEVRAETEFFFDEWFQLSISEAMSLFGGMDREEVKQLVESFCNSYSSDDGQDEWFGKIKAIATRHGFAEKAGDYKRNPANYKGTVADVAKVYRVLLTGRSQSPDLFSIMRAMGKDRVFARLSIASARPETLSGSG